VIDAKVIEDSVAPHGVRLTTLQLRYPRFIHAELMTHRVFSRNASSSRAIPVKTILDQIMAAPAEPVHWGKNQKGMQAREELAQPEKVRVQALWREACIEACRIAQQMADLGAHKQIVNRITEPFAHISVVLTSTEWANWDELRMHEDADPTIEALASAVYAARSRSAPLALRDDEWHLPYVTREERALLDPDLAMKVSAARCCRVSYLKHDGQKASVEEELALCDRLAAARPFHASPFEHQATPLLFEDQWSGNFRGWLQHRKLAGY